MGRGRRRGGAWRAEMPLPTARQGLAAAAVGGRLLALGGQRVAGAEVEELSAVEAFQPLAPRAPPRALNPRAPRGGGGALSLLSSL